MRDFHVLKVWDKAHRLTLQLYETTRSFPKEELYGLTSQIRRAAASIGANIAEGAVKSKPEFARFLLIALGSASELEYHLLLARDLRLLREQEYAPLSGQVVELKKMLTSFIQYLSGAAKRPTVRGLPDS